MIELTNSHLSQPTNCKTFSKRFRTFLISMPSQWTKDIISVMHEASFLILSFSSSTTIHSQIVIISMTKSMDIVMFLYYFLCTLVSISYITNVLLFTVNMTTPMTKARSKNKYSPQSFVVQRLKKSLQDKYLLIKKQVTIAIKRIQSTICQTYMIWLSTLPTLQLASVNILRVTVFKLPIL
jgi:hypothetical protein